MADSAKKPGIPLWLIALNLLGLPGLGVLIWLNSLGTGPGSGDVGMILMLPQFKLPVMVLLAALITDLLVGVGVLSRAYPIPTRVRRIQIIVVAGILLVWAVAKLMQVK